MTSFGDPLVIGHHSVPKFHQISGWGPHIFTHTDRNSGVHGRIPHPEVNPKSGAIALGHPLGATGARQIATLLPELKRQGKKWLGRLGSVLGWCGERFFNLWLEPCHHESNMATDHSERNRWFPYHISLRKTNRWISSCLCRYLHVSPIIVIPCHTKVGWVVPARFNFSLGTVDRFCWDSRANPLVVATEPAEVGFQVEFRNWKTCLKKYAWVYSGYLRVYFEPYKPPCGEAKMIFFCDRPVTHPCEGWAWPPCAWEVAWAPPQWLSWSEWLIGFSRIGL